MRFRTLDAMRGVAAVLVVARHTGPHTLRFSYLAVDLFFVLSGFVLAYVNDDRFRAGMTVREFMVARTKRLAPVYLLGLALGVLSILIVGDPRLTAEQLSFGLATEAIGLPAFLIHPAPSPFPINGNYWSLFFEFWVASLGFAVFWRRWQDDRFIMPAILFCAASLVLSEKLYHTMDVGWAWQNFWAGAARVGFSFLVGLRLARLHKVRKPRLRAPAWCALVLLVAIMCVPLKERVAHAFELFAVFVAFPAMVYWGASARERRPAMGQVLGDASYVAYAIHRPIIEMLHFGVLFLPAGTVAALAGKRLSDLGEATFIVAVVIVSWWLERAYDRPIRRWLAGRPRWRSGDTA